MLDDTACQFYIMENEREWQERSRTEKERRKGEEKETDEEKCRGEKKKITCSTDVLAGFMLGLKSGCKFGWIRRRTRIHVNIS